MISLAKIVTNHLKNYIMKRLFITIIIVASSLIGFAQQDAMFTHYMYNTMAINPAYAGSRNTLSVTALHRSQWIGFAGAPTTQTLTIHSPIIQENIGLGASVINDKIGPVNMTSLSADFSYKIKLGKKANFAFGIKAALAMLNGNINSLEVADADDEIFVQNINARMMPNFGFGMYYYTDKYYVGLSTPKLLENSFVKEEIMTGTKVGGEIRHYFFIAGAIFDINNSLKVKPSTFVKYTGNAPLEADITANFIYNDKVSAGLMFRTGDAVGLLLGMNLSKKLLVGYSFDWSYSINTITYNKGSHEIMLQYDFSLLPKTKVMSPRYF